ncbi:MAG: beta-galactosidase [Verrucomicrobia bacterium]|nr:beta-galactosidase [Verrucomicrobiota bacterium]MCH8527994.1 beta-galactosidase [Kiritimatiellia bacterium]
MYKKSPPSHLRPVPLSSFLFGVCYYPEHWDADTRRLDAERMRAAGINVVRMAEFAAEVLEPAPGQFDFRIFDDTIAELAEHGIRTILGTPTAAPPRWLSAAHPDALAVDAAGQPLQHGSRQHMSLSHPALSEYSQRVTRALAEHYAENPHVIGWQTDNEFHCHFSEDHSGAAQEDFRAFLREKYGQDIEALNRAWGNNFWALTYSDFEEICTPRGLRPCYPNPTQQLDYARFLSWRVTRFQHEQVQILRTFQPRWFIFHNGCFPHIDYRGDFIRDLDFLGYDSYPGFSYDVTRRASDHAYNLDRTRAWSGNFIIPEHQSGPGGQAPYFHDNPEPGEIRKLTYASLAHGTDSILYFRWRTCRYGAEMYWCGVLDQDNVPRRRYEEIQRIGREMAVLGPELLGTSVRMDVGVAYADYDAMEARATMPLGLPSLSNHAEAIHRWFFRGHYAAGCVHPADVLDGLKMLIIPHWEVMDPDWLPHLRDFVERGGTLVLGAICATRDTNNHVIAETPPGFLRELAGVSVEEYSRKNRADQRSWVMKWDDREHTAEGWVEILAPEEGTEVLAAWTARHAAGKPAVTCRRQGKGRVLYVGTLMTEAFMERFGPALVRSSGAEPVLPDLPEDVEAAVRYGDGRELLFLINHADMPCELGAVPEGDSLVGERPSEGRLTLPAYGVSVLRSGR